MNRFIDYILQDWQANKDTSFKSRLVLLIFRITQKFSNLATPFVILSYIFRGIYQILVEFIFGIELPWDTEIGHNTKLIHGIALVVNHNTKIGANCILRHSTTIGNKQLKDGSYSDSPIIGHNVDIGSNVVILGPIKIGDNAVIGAGSVIVKDVPEGAVVVGNPGKVIRINNLHTSSKNYAKTETS